MSDFLGIHGTALELREQRLQLLAANIANADTPNYQAQDLDFTGALNAAEKISSKAAQQVRKAVTGTIAGVKVVLKEPFKSK